MPARTLAADRKQSATDRRRGPEESDLRAGADIPRVAGDFLEAAMPVAGLAIGRAGVPGETATARPATSRLAALRRQAQHIGLHPDAGRPNGLPAALRTGIEARSGFDMGDVNVHRDSSLPAEVGAQAITRGTEIHLAPGQESFLPHEAWHVVQQKQGRVQATYQAKARFAVNDDAGLEREADVQGAAAAMHVDGSALPPRTDAFIPTAPVVQCNKGEVAEKGTMGSGELGISGEILNVLSVAAYYVPDELVPLGAGIVVISGIGLGHLALKQLQQAKTGDEQLLAVANLAAATASIASGVVGVMKYLDPTGVSTAAVDTAAYGLWACAEFGNYLRVGYALATVTPENPINPRDPQHGWASGVKTLGAVALATHSTLPNNLLANAGNIALAIGAYTSGYGHFADLDKEVKAGGQQSREDVKLGSSLERDNRYGATDKSGPLFDSSDLEYPKVIPDFDLNEVRVQLDELQVSSAQFASGR